MRNEGEKKEKRRSDELVVDVAPSGVAEGERDCWACKSPDEVAAPVWGSLKSRFGLFR